MITGGEDDTGDDIATEETELSSHPSLHVPVWGGVRSNLSNSLGILAKPGCDARPDILARDLSLLHDGDGHDDRPGGGEAA